MNKFLEGSLGSISNYILVSSFLFLFKFVIREIFIIFYCCLCFVKLVPGLYIAHDWNDLKMQSNDILCALNYCCCHIELVIGGKFSIIRLWYVSSLLFEAMTAERVQILCIPLNKFHLFRSAMLFFSSYFFVFK